MKRRYTAALLCAFIMLLAMTAFLTSLAEPDFMFTVVENYVMLPILSDTFSFLSGNTYYVYSAHFKQLDAVKNVYYNERLQQMVVYNINVSLYFDLSNNTTFDNAGNTYDNTAMWKNGNIFLPLDVVAKVFSLSTGYLPVGDNTPAPILRIGSTPPGSITDKIFADSQRTRLHTLYNNYMQSLTVPASTQPGGATVPPTTTTAPPAQPSLVYLTFEGPLDSEYTPLILEEFAGSQTSAAFFIPPGDILDNAGLLRRIYAEGHAIGLMLSGEWSSAQEAADEFEAANSLLRSVLFTKTRLVCIGGASDQVQGDARDALVSQGARLWNSTISPSMDDAAAAQNNLRTVRNALAAASGTSVIGLSCGKAGYELLPSLLNHLERGNFSLLTITQWDTPVNPWGEKR